MEQREPVLGLVERQILETELSVYVCSLTVCYLGNQGRYFPQGPHFLGRNGGKMTPALQEFCVKNAPNRVCSYQYLCFRVILQIGDLKWCHHCSN